MQTGHLGLGALSIALVACASLGLANPDEHSYLDARYHGGTEAAQLATSPVTLEELELLKQTVLWSDEDTRYLRMSRAILEPQVDAILDTWYGFVGSTPHLLQFFANSAGKPDGEYLAKVRARFGAWIGDTADARFDQEWLDYQHEIGLRHHYAKKNRTDGADAVDIVSFRYLIALHVPITTTLEPFLAKGDASPDDVQGMLAAWRKSVLLQVILWSQPYVRDGQF